MKKIVKFDSIEVGETFWFNDLNQLRCWEKQDEKHALNADRQVWNFAKDCQVEIDVWDDEPEPNPNLVVWDDQRSYGQFPELYDAVAKALALSREYKLRTYVKCARGNILFDCHFR